MGKALEQKEAGLNIVVVGHVDHGKSTVIGRLLYDTDSLPQGAIDKVEKIAHDTGKPFEYAYLLDAFEDVPQDIRNGSYNIFAEMYLRDDFRDKAGLMLQMMLSESCRSFERLPIVKYSGILRNILYSGVWTRYRAVLRKREKEQEKKYV